MPIDSMQISVIEASGLEDEVSFQASSTMASHLHSSELFDPELPHDDVVHAAVHVTPCIRFSPSLEQTTYYRVFSERRLLHTIPR